MGNANALNVPILHRILDGVVLADNPSANGWKKIGVQGEWRGHAMGEFKLDEKIFSEIVNNFKKKQIPPRMEAHQYISTVDEPHFFCGVFIADPLDHSGLEMVCGVFLRSL